MFRLVDSTALAMNWVFTVMPESIDAVALSPNISITAKRKVELVSIQKELSPLFYVIPKVRRVNGGGD